MSDPLIALLPFVDSCCDYVITSSVMKDHQSPEQNACVVMSICCSEAGKYSLQSVTGGVSIRYNTSDDYQNPVPSHVISLALSLLRRGGVYVTKWTKHVESTVKEESVDIVECSSTQSDNHRNVTEEVHLQSLTVQCVTVQSEENSCANSNRHVVGITFSLESS